MKKTMFDKIWDLHVVDQIEGGAYLIYIDRHFVHEVTSPQAFESLRLSNRKVRSPQATFATMDHNVSTKNKDINSADPISKIQMKTLIKNCEMNHIQLFDINHPDQGIVHVIFPEMGLTHPGMTIVCGDSHTATHGAFGSLAFGIGTSEVEHVLATQTLQQKKPKNMKIQVNGQLAKFVTAKDLILSIIGKIGTDGGTGHVIEYAGESFSSLSMEGRMTVCNMSIEAGARAGLIQSDQTTFDYLKDKDFSPKGKEWEEALKFWKSLKSDENANFDKIVEINSDEIAPMVTWGTSPGQVVKVTESIPDPDKVCDPLIKSNIQNALGYMGLKPNTKMRDITVDKVFIGSCTNSRIEDLREAASIVKGQKVSPKVKAMVVPGSGRVKRKAETEGLHEIFMKAGFEWREPGCSMCLAMNDDVLNPKERCASTSNRNFEGRQGKDGRTHLVSPSMAAAAAIEGRFVDIRNWS